MTTPYLTQNPSDVARLITALEGVRKEKKRGGFSVKKTTFDVQSSRIGAKVDSWRFHDWDYKRRDLPTYARGLFTTYTQDSTPEIAVRGYDKFFNVNEVNETKWETICARTQPPYELTLKENGCIIFIAGLEDDTLLVCSKHSTGERSDVQRSHASAGEASLERQLASLGKSKADLARELRQRNATAVAELCDDSFEEHILAYGPEKAGLYLHGINLNLSEFHTYPSQAVQEFADQWGFRQIGLIVQDSVSDVKAFLEEAATTGAHGGRDVEGFVIRCKMSENPSSRPFHDWFFKFKFEEPYLMYRQWRECTKAIIAKRQPKFKKHARITEEYLLYARKRLDAEPELGKQYNDNHGIIALRDDFLAFKNMKGADAANLDTPETVVAPEVTKDVILSPISTIGCGKTTIALSLSYLFSWGHIQNDNISGKGRPPKFTKAVLEELKTHPVVFADRNNSMKKERKQLVEDVKSQHPDAKLVCLHFRHDEESVDEIRKVTQDRIRARGDNHQTIHAATDEAKFLKVMEGFLDRFEPCSPHSYPDDDFDLMIDIDPVAGSRANLATVISQLQLHYPNLLQKSPSPQELDDAVQKAVDYKPTFKHTIANGEAFAKPGRSKSNLQTKDKRQLEFMSLEVPHNPIVNLLEQTFRRYDSERSSFYRQLQKTKRVQPKFHVTLMHRAAAQEHPQLWQRYTQLFANAGSMPQKFGECSIELQHIVFDDRIMTIVVRFVDNEGKWDCVNRVAHMTVGTRDFSAKPKESNDLLARWLDKGTAGTGISELPIEPPVLMKGEVRGVPSR